MLGTDLNIQSISYRTTVKKVHEKVLAVFDSAPERMRQLREKAEEITPVESEQEAEG